MKIFKKHMIFSTIALGVIIANYYLWRYGKGVIDLVVLISFVVSSIYELLSEKKKGNKRDKVKIGIIIFYLLIIGIQTMLLPFFNPTFIRSEIHKKLLSGQENMAFHTDLEILEPISLKIKDTYINLMYPYDYFCEGDSVYIKYPFGNDDIKNEDIGINGVVFTYKTRAFRFSKYYKDFEQERAHVRHLMYEKEQNYSWKGQSAERFKNPEFKIIEVKQQGE